MQESCIAFIWKCRSESCFTYNLFRLDQKKGKSYISCVPQTRQNSQNITQVTQPAALEVTARDAGKCISWDMGLLPSQSLTLEKEVMKTEKEAAPVNRFQQYTRQDDNNRGKGLIFVVVSVFFSPGLSSSPEITSGDALEFGLVRK